MYVLSASPQHFRYYFNGRTEIVVSRDRQCDEEDQEPQNEDDDSKREEFFSECAKAYFVVFFLCEKFSIYLPVEEGNIVDKSVNIEAVFIVLDKVTSL